MNLSPVKPIDIQACQEECANIFGFDFDIKFCKMPEALYQSKDQETLAKMSQDTKHTIPDLLPKFDNCLGLSNFCWSLNDFKISSPQDKQVILGKRQKRERDHSQHTENQKQQRVSSLE